VAIRVIPAAKWPLFDAWFRAHARARLARGFHAMNVAGLAPTRALAREAPLLVVSNHTAWSDPLVVLTLATALGVDAYAMMDAKNLATLPFFRRVGAFGVDLASPRDGARAIRYAAGLLDRPGRAVWIFPQGKTCPVTAPLELREGSARVARHAKTCRVVPMGLRYEHADDERASIWVSFGEPIGSADATTERQRAAITHELARLEDAVRARSAAGFDPLFEARPSWLGGVATRMLGWLAG